MGNMNQNIHSAPKKEIIFKNEEICFVVILVMQGNQKLRARL